MYKSQSGNECTCQQYLAELMCIRQAKKNGERLGPGFWNTDRWRKTYKLQIIKANALLRVFSERALVASLHTKKGELIWSLHWRDLAELVIIEENRIAQTEEKLDKAKDIELTKEDVEYHAQVEKTKQFNKKTQADRLRELDG